MSEKRRTSTRNRGEPPLKKRATSPPPPPPPAAAPTAIQQPRNDGLPIRLHDGQALPTLSELQDLSLSSTDYQSIAESGVLAASIEQSRRSWTVDGVFDKYWAKPSKKRSQEIHNPATDTMSRLGICSMRIEPHTFEVTLYTVKEPRISHQSTFTQQPPPIASSKIPPANTPVTTAPARPFTGQQPGAHPQPALPPFGEGFAQFDPQAPPPPIYHPFASATTNHSTSGSYNTSLSNPPHQNGAQKPPPKPSPDPVIQMLATRAASDHGLKSLMKVVASGKATQSELREFQNHIDDLNAEINAGRGPTPLHERRPSQPPSGGPQMINPPPQPAGQPPAPAIANRPPGFPPSAPKFQSETPIYSQYAPLAKGKAYNPYKPDITAIVFDFGGKGDRFLFPRFSILEYLPGGTQVIASFLLIKKDNSASSGNYKVNISYYQPVTLHLSTPHPRTLEPLARVVAPADDVRRYMNDVFDKMKPAETAYLATRLPRTKSDTIDLEKPTMTTEKGVIKPSYAPPSFVAPMAA